MTDLDTVVADADVVAVMTGHSGYFKLEPSALKEHMGKDRPVVVDGRNVVDPDAWIGRGDVN